MIDKNIERPWTLLVGSKCHPDSFDGGWVYESGCSFAKQAKNRSKKELRSSISEENQQDQVVIGVEIQEEIDRVVPVIKAIRKESGAWSQWIPGSPRWRRRGARRVKDIVNDIGRFSLEILKMAAVVGAWNMLSCLIQWWQDRIIQVPLSFLQVLLSNQSFQSKHFNRCAQEPIQDLIKSSLTFACGSESSWCPDGSYYVDPGIGFGLTKEYFITRTWDDSPKGVSDPSRGLPQTLLWSTLLEADLYRSCNGDYFWIGPGFESFDQYCSQSRSRSGAGAWYSLHKMAASLAPFSKPKRQIPISKTEGTKTKEHQLIRWLEAHRSKIHRAWAHGSSLGFERNPPRLLGLFMLRGPMAKALPLLPLSQLWRQAGLRVGVFYLSPHLIHYNDQITTRIAISDQDLQTYPDSYWQLLQAEQSKDVFQGLTEFSDDGHRLWLFCSRGAGLCDREAGAGRLDSTQFVVARSDRDRLITSCCLLGQIRFHCLAKGRHHCQEFSVLGK